MLVCRRRAANLRKVVKKRLCKVVHGRPPAPRCARSAASRRPRAGPGAQAPRPATSTRSRATSARSRSPVLLRLQAYFGIDLPVLPPRTRNRALIAELREITAGAVGQGVVPPGRVAGRGAAAAGVLARAAPRCTGARRTPRIAWPRWPPAATATASPPTAPPPAQPHEEVREFFYARHNHMARARRTRRGHVRAPAPRRRAPAAAARPSHNLGTLLERQTCWPSTACRCATRIPTRATAPLIRHSTRPRAYCASRRASSRGSARSQLAIPGGAADGGPADPTRSTSTPRPSRTRRPARSPRIGFANHFAGRAAAAVRPLPGRVRSAALRHRPAQRAVRRELRISVPPAVDDASAPTRA